jgi:hypothetical protein
MPQVSTPLPQPAGVVTAYVHGFLAPRVMAVEESLAASDDQIQTYLDAYSAGTQLDWPSLSALVEQTISVLTAGSSLCEESSHDFDVPPALPLDTSLSLQLASLREDLELFSTQIATAMRATSTDMDIARMPRRLESLRDAGYATRIGDALPILRRAETWLEAIDRETGARVTLPGFKPGAPPLEQQLALPPLQP